MQKSTVYNSFEFTIDELIEARNNTETDLFKQFVMSDAKVKKLVKSIGELNTVYNPFRVAYCVETSKPYLVGGRHRLAALLRLEEMGNISRLDEDNFASYEVIVTPVNFLADIPPLVVGDNQSRSMTKYEQKYLEYQQYKEDYEREGSFPSSRVQEVKDMGIFYHNISTHGVCTEQTMLATWGRFITKLSKLHKPLNKTLRTNEEAQAKLAEVFEEEAVKMFSKINTPAKQYTKVADKLSELVFQLGTMEDYHPLKQGETVSKEQYDWIHSEKVAKSTEPTDVSTLREKQEGLMVNLQDNLPSNGEDDNEAINVPF